MSDSRLATQPQLDVRVDVRIVSDQTDHVVIIALADTENQILILDRVKSVAPELYSILTGSVFQVDLRLTSRNHW